MEKQMKVGVVGAGTMGGGIAQVAAAAGHEVVLYDTRAEALENAKLSFVKIFDRLVEKGKQSREEADVILARISFSKELAQFKGCGLLIEAIVEDLAVKKELFAGLEEILTDDAVLATNTSSLSVTAIAAGCTRPERVIGLHFFNPAPLLPLVEVVPGLATASTLSKEAMALMKAWGKSPVLAKDTPGFIVNRVARPFYGEALRILEEGVADIPTIDHAMRSVGGFKMGPFELMDLIGNDVNFAVTRSVFEAFFNEPRYRPSLTQQRMVEAGWYGRKSGRGYYDHSPGALVPSPQDDPILLQTIVDRIVVMLINEAVDALYLRIANKNDLDLAMTKGVNYPKGLIQWADEWGAQKCLVALEALYDRYREDRYRPSPLLRDWAAGSTKIQL